MWQPLQYCLLVLASTFCTKAHPISQGLDPTTEPPPKPFHYSYEAGRAPGGKPDRYVEQEGDGTGEIRGSYTYLDPNWTWQTIKYVADPDGGFRILEGSTLGSASQPRDTKAVQKAKAEHEALFKLIAARNQIPPSEVEEPTVVEPPRETVAVQQKRRQHAQLFQQIADQHKRVAEEHKRLAQLHERD